VETVEIGGIRVAYERAGDGPPVVLLHGGLSDSREWRRQIDGLRDEYTVVAWDAPGCGRSSDPPESFRMPDYADSLASLIESCSLSPSHLVGLSFGGTLALELYRRHRELVRTLTLVSAYAGWAGSLPADVVAERLDGIMRELELPGEQVAERWIPDLLTEHAPPDVVKELVAIISDVRASGVRPMAWAMAESDLTAILGEIEVPTLLLYGEEDRRSPIELAEALAAGIPGSTLTVITEAGHQCNIEASDRFNRKLRAFLGAH
jgi:pimeloyl-ACP methyl ester carboxylesterase